MAYARLGATGLKISRLALGCMSYGDPATPGAHTWALNDDDAQPFFRQAVELGITFWDTANSYQNGTSEELVGRAITRYSRREDIVLATKVFGRMHGGPGGQGREGPLYRGLIHVRVAVREAAARRRIARLDPGSYRCRTSTTCCAARMNRS
jgi:aryl-alcohol dehydrogenase-like predicted oxidoreductase